MRFKDYVITVLYSSVPCSARWLRESGAQITSLYVIAHGTNSDYKGREALVTVNGDNFRPCLGELRLIHSIDTYLRFLEKLRLT